MKKKCLLIISLVCISFSACINTDRKENPDEQRMVNSEKEEVKNQSDTDNSAIALKLSQKETEEWILYPLEINGKYGFINQFGELIVNPQYRRANMSRCGVAVGEKDKVMYYLDSKGNVLFSLENQLQLPRSFSDGFLACRILNGEQSNWGFLDKSGKSVIPPIYAAVDDFSEGLANVTDSNGNTFFINKENVRVFGDVLHTGGPFHNGYAYVREKVIDDFYVDRVTIDGIPYQENINGTFGGIINQRGELIIPYILGMYALYSEGLFATSYKDIEAIKNQTLMGMGVGYINEKNEMVIEPRFSLAYEFTDGVAVASLNGNTYGLINKQGEFIIQPQYADLRTKSNGVFLFSKDGVKYGFMDEQERALIPATFDFANSFDGPLAFIKKGDIPGYVNREGKVFLATDYE